MDNVVRLAQTQIQETANQPQALIAADTGPITSSHANPTNLVRIAHRASTPPPVTVTYAGIFKAPTAAAPALGFVGQDPPAQIAYTNGTLANGVLTISSNALGGTGQLTIPLVPGTASFGPNGTTSPLGPVAARAFVRRHVFYANLTPVNAPNQREFVAGGLPVGRMPSRGNRFDRIVAFTVSPMPALQSNIPFIRSNAGGNLANAYVSPLYLVAPANTRDRRCDHGKAARVLQAEPRDQRPGAPTSNRCWSRRSGPSPLCRVPPSPSVSGRGARHLAVCRRHPHPFASAPASHRLSTATATASMERTRSRALCWIRRHSSTTASAAA